MLVIILDIGCQSELALHVNADKQASYFFLPLNNLKLYFVPTESF